MKEHLLALSSYAADLSAVLAFAVGSQSRPAGDDHQLPCGRGLVELRTGHIIDNTQGIPVMTRTERLAAVFAVAFAIIVCSHHGLELDPCDLSSIQEYWQWGKAPPSAEAHRQCWYGFIHPHGALGGDGAHHIICDSFSARLPSWHLACGSSHFVRSSTSHTCCCRMYNEDVMVDRSNLTFGGCGRM